MLCRPALLLPFGLSVLQVAGRILGPEYYWCTLRAHKRSVGTLVTKRDEMCKRLIIWQGDSLKMWIYGRAYLIFVAFCFTRFVSMINRYDVFGCIISTNVHSIRSLFCDLSLFTRRYIGG